MHMLQKLMVVNILDKTKTRDVSFKLNKLTKHLLMPGILLNVVFMGCSNT